MSEPQPATAATAAPAVPRCRCCGHPYPGSSMRGLCQSCYDRIRHAGTLEHWPRLGTSPCVHCGGPRQARKAGRGLCVRCYYDPAIQGLYPLLRGRRPLRGAAARNAREGGGEGGDAGAPLPRRRHGDPWLCFWCGKVDVGGPLRVCDSCRRDHEERAATMPALRPNEAMP